jgi:hypothetical protein
LAAAASCTISVTFRPITTPPVTKTALLTITVAAPGTTQSVTLNGTVLVPRLNLSPTSLAFGSQAVAAGPTPAQTVTVSNTGGAPLTINSITFGGTNPGQFARTTTCPISPATLAAAGSCTVSVTFDPLNTGAKSASLNVNVAAPATSRSVALTGTGI